MRTMLCFLLCAATCEAAPPKKARPESSYTVDAKGEKLPAGRVNLLGKTVDFAKFANSCQQKTGNLIASGSLDSQAVRISGSILEVIEGAGWKVGTKLDVRTQEWTEPVVVTVAEIGGKEGADATEFKVGNVMNALGVVVPETGEVSAWYVELTPPGLQPVIVMREIPALTPGTPKTYVVDYRTRNSGQEIRNVNFVVRLTQGSPPVGDTQKYMLEKIATTGRSHFKVGFEWQKHVDAGVTGDMAWNVRIVSYDP